jgi:hypothetical protein
MGSRSIFALTLLICVASARADTLDFKRSDHQLHASVAFGATLATERVLGSADVDFAPAIAAVLVLGAGYWKESRDKEWSQGDIEADWAGALTAAVFTTTFHF